MRMLEVEINYFFILFFKIVFAFFLVIMFGCFFVNLIYMGPAIDEIITGMIVPYIPSKALSPVIFIIMNFKLIDFCTNRSNNYAA